MSKVMYNPISDMSLQYISYEVSKEKKTGSDCSLTDGDADRVLTLTNTSTTKTVLVIVSGAVQIEDQDYTVSHLSSNSTITFLNRIADAMYIEVLRWS